MHVPMLFTVFKTDLNPIRQRTLDRQYNESYTYALRPYLNIIYNNYSRVVLHLRFVGNFYCLDKKKTKIFPHDYGNNYPRYKCLML